MGNQPKIDNVTGFLMLGTAVFYDGLQAIIGLFDLIPVVGNIFALIFSKLVSVFAILTFLVWLIVKGADWKSKMILFGGGGVELLPIPFLSDLPFFIGVVVAIIIRERMLAKTGGVTSKIGVKT